jgi:hypothetical protein
MKLGLLTKILMYKQYQEKKKEKGDPIFGFTE